MIVITHPSPKPSEIDTIHSLFESGLELLHVRKPEYSEKELKKFLTQIKPEYRAQLVLHNHHQLAPFFGINRIHYTEKARIEMENPPIKFTRPIKKGFQKKITKGFQLSTSVHSISDFNSLKDHFSYAFLSPVFYSISKENYTIEFNMFEEIKKRKNFKTQLVALGGIDSKKINQTLENGFDRVAVLGTIWTSETAIQNFKSCQKIVQTF